MRTMFFVVTDRNKQVSYPPLGEKWKEGVLEVAKNVFILQTARSSATISSDLPLREPPAPSKRQKTGDIHDDAASSVATAPCALNMSLDATSTEAGAVNTSGTTSTTTNSTSQEVLSRNSQSVSSYWNSLDACNLFGLKVNEPLDANNVVYDMLKLRVELLQSANSSESGWRNVIEGGDPDNLCTPSDVFAVRGRSTILCLAYQLAIQNMNQWTWEQCFTQACSQLNSLGIQQATHHRTVQDWNGIFRHHGRFPHPNHAVRCGKQPLPLLFEKYPVAMNEIIQFGVNSLTTLTVESVHGFCHDTLIPKLFEQWRSDIEHGRGSRNRDQDPVLTKEMFMNEHKISTLSIPTCWRWMHRLGFTYNTQRKGYYVDGHQRSDVVASRRAFCETYLTDVEPRCVRWIHVSQHELTTTHAILNPEFGYPFVDSLGESQVEFHVDYCTSHATKDNELLVGKIPRISIRAPLGSIPIEIFGQDESVFSQFLFPTKSWIGPNQERGLFPKSLGEGLMISAFVSRDSGFGMPVSSAQLD